MRLIDADALMEYCQNQKSKTISCNDIARFPTAYDVDKVVEELELMRNENPSHWHTCDVIDREEAIDIVRRGGVNG